MLFFFWGANTWRPPEGAFFTLFDTRQLAIQPLQKKTSTKQDPIFQYPLVNKHSYWKWQFIVDFPIKNCVFHIKTSGTNNPYATHGAGIFTYITGWWIVRANVGIHIPAPWSIWDRLWAQQFLSTCWNGFLTTVYLAGSMLYDSTGRSSNWLPI